MVDKKNIIEFLNWMISEAKESLQNNSLSESSEGFERGIIFACEDTIDVIEGGQIFIPPENKTKFKPNE